MTNPATSTPRPSRSSNPLRAVVTIPAWAVGLVVIVLFVQGSFSPLRSLTSSVVSADDARRYLSASAAEDGTLLYVATEGGGSGGSGSLRSGPSSNDFASALVSDLNDETNVPIPRRTDGAPMSIEERLRYLELKTNAASNFGAADPTFGSAVRKGKICRKFSDLVEFGCGPGWEGYNPSRKNCGGLFDHRMCLDGLPAPREWDVDAERPKVAVAEDGGEGEPPCLVYDFGVREQPQFGAVMARTFGCEVHAFDPSPVSQKWWKSKSADKLRALPNYHFHPYGAGGIDGDLTLMEYDWGQVSIIRYPSYVVDCGESLEGDAPCDTPRASDKQTSFTLPVKTLPAIMRELGHEDRTITVLKVDVEGSEYAFLENALDRWGGGLPRVEQLTLEWHHMGWDPRFGEGSSPPINSIATLLHASGLELFWQHSVGGWVSNVRAFQRLGMNDVRYNVASFMRPSK